MTRRERNLLMKTAAVGVGLTVLITVLDTANLFDPLERWLYDRRIRDCQFFKPPPTDRLVHIDIDDAALSTVGPWPWPRTKLAQILDEINRAGAKTVGLDIIFPEPQPIQLVERSDGSIERIDHDANFATAVQRCGKAIMPISFMIRQSRTELYQQMYNALLSNLEIDQEAMVEHLRQFGFSKNFLVRDDETRFLRARTEAMRFRIEQALAANDTIAPAELVRKLLPAVADRNVTSSVHIRLLDQELGRVRSLQALRRHTRDQWPRSIDALPVVTEMPPIRLLAQASGATGFVYYEPDEDGVVRSVVLWTDNDGSLFPQLGLALACTFLDVNVQDVRLNHDAVIIPRTPRDGGEIVLPVHHRRYEKLGQTYGMNFDLPWFGDVDEWDTMYDPEHQSIKQHLPVNAVWRIIETSGRMRLNNRTADDAIKVIYEVCHPDRRDAFLANPLPLDDPTARADLIHELLADRTVTDMIDFVGSFDAADLDQPSRDFLRSYKDLKTILTENRALRDQRDLQRAELQIELEGKAVLIGWTATGVAADFVPTSLHAKCPGVIVHGVVFNAILTGEAWTRTAPWVTSAVTIIVGLLTVVLLVTFSPGGASVASISLLLTYFVFNGVILFDYGNIIVGIAGPALSVLLVWSGCTLFRFVIERQERARIKKRFESYVDPVLVDYVIEHPEKARLDGEMRQLTVVFTDLQGFTTLNELLKERTVGILNEYTELMVPIIRANRGYVNKFLGDGIMFFYGAPRENEFHARDAVITALRMQQMMPKFNKTLADRDLPTVKMRVGIASGPMVVGDAGPADASDYTVLGDTVNLSARLESANKYTGTLVMLNEGTAQAIGDDLVLLRPLARLQVKGKSEGVMVYEPLALIAEATDEHRRHAALGKAVVDAYIAADFDQCLAALGELEAAFGETNLTIRYREACEQYKVQLPDDFAGQIILESK
jgi:class 3 adenylate cyclase/CHASE2 domain-containing sensor protein